MMSRITRQAAILAAICWSALPLGAAGQAESALQIAFESIDHDERRALQRVLQSEGLYSGGIDGTFGPATLGALAAKAQMIMETVPLASGKNFDAIPDAAALMVHILGQPFAFDIGTPAREVETLPASVDAYMKSLRETMDGTFGYAGDVDGDGDADLLVTGYSNDGGGNSLDIDYVLFENTGAGYELIGPAVAFGLEPKDVSFFNGGIRYQTIALRDQDPRCCPTGWVVVVLELDKIRAAEPGGLPGVDASEANSPYGDWICTEGHNFTLTPDSYDGQRVKSIEAFGEEDAYGITMPDDWRFGFFRNEDGTWTWSSPQTGDTFECLRDR